MADTSTAAPGTYAPHDPAPIHRRRSHHAIAAAIGTLATLIGLLFLAWLVLFVTKGRFLKHSFERLASSYTHRTVTVAGDFNLYFDPIATQFLAEGLSISNPDWASKPAFLTARRIELRIETIPLLFGRKHIAWLGLADAAIDAEWRSGHKANTWTFNPGAAPSPFEMPEIKRAAVAGTTVRFRDPALFLGVDIAFDPVGARDNKVGQAIGFAGKGTLRDEPLTLDGSLQSPDATLAGGGNRFELQAATRFDRLTASGTLPGAFVIENAPLEVAARGRNLRNLFDLLGVVVPDTRSYHLASDLVKVGDEWRFTKLRGGYGESDLAGSLTVRMQAAEAGQPSRVKLIADIASRSVDLVDIGPFIGYDPTVLAAKGPTAAATTQHARAAYPRIIPDAPLRSEALKMFDADVRYRVANIKQPFVPISNIALTLGLDHSLLTLSPLTFDMAGGHVAADISIDARVPQVMTAYDIRMSPTPVGKLLAKFGVAQSGTTGTVKARVQLKGTGNSLRQSLATSNGRIAIILPRGTFWMSYVQLAEFDVGTFVQRMFQNKLKEPVQVNCGLIAFTVRDGIAAADPILIDTQKNVMTAKGGFSFRDESLSLAFRAKAKKISLFSGQSPIGIGGHFAAPSFQIVTPQLLARVGAGVALGLVGGPAALLAFVDPGDAKGAQCAPILEGARADAQRTDKGKPRKDVGNGSTGDVKAEKKDKKFLGIL